MNSSISTINKVSKKEHEFSISFKISKTGYKIIAAVLILAVLSLAGYKINKYQSGKIMPKVKIAGFNVSGKTPQEAKALIESYIKELDNNGPEIKYQTQTIQPKLSELGTSFEVGKTIDHAFGIGRTPGIKNRIKETYHLLVYGNDIQLEQNFDEKKLDDYLSKIAEVVEISPENANLTIDNGNIVEVPEKLGRGLDKNDLKSQLKNFINNKSTSDTITLKTADLQPEILLSETTDAKESALKYLNSAPINLGHEDKNYSISRVTLGQWIVFASKNGKLNANISDQKIANFAGDVISDIEIPMENKEIAEDTGEILKEGQDGRGVDEARLVNDIKNRILSGSVSETIAVATFPIIKGEKVINPHAQAGRYDGHYIDVNLSEQTLYAFDGKTLVNQFLISSGKRGYETPEGEFSVWGKTRAQVMDGPDFYLPNVQWISWFNGEISVHGAYWHNNFGTPMSHGCINAANENAEFVYNFVDIGTPVYVHY